MYDFFSLGPLITFATLFWSPRLSKIQSNLIFSSRTIGIFEGTKIVGKLAAKEDFNPGLESSKTIELFLFIPLNWIAFKYGNGFGFFNSTSSLAVSYTHLTLPTICSV